MFGVSSLPEETRPDDDDNITNIISAIIFSEGQNTPNYVLKIK
jgi:hypothetical protein